MIVVGQAAVIWLSLLQTVSITAHASPFHRYFPTAKAEIVTACHCPKFTKKNHLHIITSLFETHTDDCGWSITSVI
jgi:hypothetical protein